VDRKVESVHADYGRFSGGIDVVKLCAGIDIVAVCTVREVLQEAVDDPKGIWRITDGGVEEALEVLYETIAGHGEG
jgi:hypothetical protein